MYGFQKNYHFIFKLQSKSLSILIMKCTANLLNFLICVWKGLPLCPLFEKIFKSLGVIHKRIIM